MVAKGGTSFDYDQDNRVAAIVKEDGSTAQYGYDGRNLRVKRVADGKTTYSSYDQAGRLITGTGSGLEK